MIGSNRIFLLIFAIIFGLSACQRAQDNRQKITVAHNWGGPEREAFDSILKEFEKQNSEIRIEVRSIASGEYGPWLLNQFAAGVAPDVFVTASPGLMNQLAKAGKLQSISSEWQSWKDQKWYSSRWEELVSFNSQVYALPFKTSAKGLIWYSPKRFQELGFNVPKTYEEFLKLIEEARKKNIQPLSIGARDAWPLTDWFEQLLLRFSGTSSFRALAANEISWASPEVVKAFEEYTKLMNLAFPKDALSVGFVEAVHGLWDQKALMQLQGGWVNLMTKDYDASMQPEKDYDFFQLPGRARGEPPALIVGGDFVMASASAADSSRVKALLSYLASPDSQSQWVERGGYVAPNQMVPLEKYPDVLGRKEASLVREADNLVFDLDDQFSAELQRKFFEELQEFYSHKDPKRITQSLQKISGK